MSWPSEPPFAIILVNYGSGIAIEPVYLASQEEVSLATDSAEKQGFPYRLYQSVVMFDC